MNHKQYLSERIREQTREYISRGGHVRRAAPGESGAAEPSPRQHRRRPLVPRSSVTRTPVPEVVAAIEARKQARRAASRSRGRRRPEQPRRRMVYDDFGEPLRWEWTND